MYSQHDKMLEAGHDIRYIAPQQAVWAYERAGAIDQLIKSYEQDGAVPQLREMLSLFADRVVDSACDGSRQFEYLTKTADHIKEALDRLDQKEAS